MLPRCRPHHWAASSSCSCLHVTLDRSVLQHITYMRMYLSKVIPEVLTCTYVHTYMKGHLLYIRMYFWLTQRSLDVLCSYIEVHNGTRNCISDCVSSCGFGRSPYVGTCTYIGKVGTRYRRYQGLTGTAQHLRTEIGAVSRYVPSAAFSLRLPPAPPKEQLSPQRPKLTPKPPTTHNQPGSLTPPPIFKSQYKLQTPPLLLRAPSLHSRQDK